MPEFDIPEEISIAAERLYTETINQKRDYVLEMMEMALYQAFLEGRAFSALVESGNSTIQ